jgi:hypothetical protein
VFPGSDRDDRNSYAHADKYSTPHLVYLTP